MLLSLSLADDLFPSISTFERLPRWIFEHVVPRPQRRYVHSDRLKSNSYLNTRKHLLPPLPLLPKNPIQLLLNHRMIPINPIRPTTNRQKIVRNPHPLGQLTRQIPSEKRHPLPHIRLKRIRNRSKAIRTPRPIFLLADIVVLLEDKFARPVDGDEPPGREVGVWGQVDSLGPFVAEFQWEREGLGLLRVHSATAFVGAAPVGGVADEVEDCFCWVCEGCLGGYTEFSHGLFLLLGRKDVDLGGRTLKKPLFWFLTMLVSKLVTCRYLRSMGMGFVTSWESY